jgi:FkbM family methyltransferase
MRPDQLELLALIPQVNLYEILIRELCKARCQLGDVCIDAGANQGNHTKGMIAAVGHLGVVHAFEPIPFLAEALRSFAAKQKLPIVVHQLALSDRKGSATFQLVRNVPGWSGLFKREYSGPADIKEIEVETATADDILLNHIESCRFYKLDLEAGEFNALRGSSKLMAQFNPLIVFENGFSRTAKDAGYTKEEWFRFFEDSRYSVFDLYGHRVTPQRWPDVGQPYNSIAVARDSDDEQFIATEWKDTLVDEIIVRARNGSLKWP